MNVLQVPSSIPKSSSEQDYERSSSDWACLLPANLLLAELQTQYECYVNIDHCHTCMSPLLGEKY